MSIVLTRSVVLPFTAEAIAKTDSFSMQDSGIPTSPVVYDRLLRTDSAPSSEATSLLDTLLKTDSLDTSELRRVLDILLRSDPLAVLDMIAGPTRQTDVARFRPKSVKGWDILFGSRKDWGTRMEPRKSWLVEE
jgi:hypothetical protein